MTHHLIRRTTRDPHLGTRLLIRCRPCREQMPRPSDHDAAVEWVQRHAGVDRPTAVQMLRDAGRWVG